MNTLRLRLLTLATLTLSTPLVAQKVPTPTNGVEASGVYQIIRSADRHFARIDHDVLYADADAREWSPLYLPVTESARLYDIDADASRLRVATSEGLFLWGEESRTWSQVSTLPMTRIDATPGEALLGAGPTGLIRSTDQGASWNDVLAAEIDQLVTGLDGTIWSLPGRALRLSSPDSDRSTSPMIEA